MILEVPAGAPIRLFAIGKTYNQSVRSEMMTEAKYRQPYQISDKVLSVYFKGSIAANLNVDVVNEETEEIVGSFPLTRNTIGDKYEFKYDIDISDYEEGIYQLKIWCDMSKLAINISAPIGTVDMEIVKAGNVLDIEISAPLGSVEMDITSPIPFAVKPSFDTPENSCIADEVTVYVDPLLGHTDIEVGTKLYSDSHLTTLYEPGYIAYGGVIWGVGAGIIVADTGLTC